MLRVRIMYSRSQQEGITEGVEFRSDVAMGPSPAGVNDAESGRPEPRKVMLKTVLFAVAAAALFMAMGFADQPTGKLEIPAGRTDPTNGKQMYTSYCAPCHGAEGRGNGPVAPALRTPPTDLTGLAKANNGKFPDNHIVSVLRFGTESRAHGSAEMPVWGTVFNKMSKVNLQETGLRTANLSRYLESLQAK